MPIPENEIELSGQISSILKAGLIPAKIVVYDRKSEDVIDHHVVGCYAVPRKGEVIAYGETQLVVINVHHEFQATRLVEGTQFRLQILTIGCYVDEE